MEIDFCNKECCLELEKAIKKIDVEQTVNLLDELKRRVEITYRTRIIATNRLRDKNTEYKRLNIYYSVLVTGGSILTIGMQTKNSQIPASNIVLMFSIVLTYFMFYTSEQNLQERAYKMEETFKGLDKLRNKISIMLEYNKLDITEEMCKKLYKEYEAILASIENHEEIDYYMYKLDCLKKEHISDDKKEEYSETKGKVKKYTQWKSRKIFLKYFIPTVVMIMLILPSIGL
ncbi:MULTISPECIES: SLATT domain-containing protein [Clostridium]|uniref:SLATT domain-containing protein n=1 Tax=Clostridium frigoriphilum TaxID=443253 RepID=A0ABU7UPI4_9CLOT|nr:SLATT domain-containing protein [Clostridium sp. DSM 17811]MBU3099285.1 SLATT domain-containing protein [Clostridium sp. DSM 17811]